MPATKWSYRAQNLAVLDAEGYALCPDCDSRIKCGTIGLANLKKRYCRMKACKAV
jgi:hypothetical protein